MRGKAWAGANAKIMTAFCQPWPKAPSLAHERGGRWQDSVMEERLCGCKLTVLTVRFSSLQASAVDRTEKHLIQPFDLCKHS